MKTKLLTICLLLVTSQVFAEDNYNWKKIDVTLDGDYIYYGDIDSISKNESGNYNVWILENDKVKKQSTLIRTEINCRLHRKRWIHVEQYEYINAKGKKIGTFDFESLNQNQFSIWVTPKPNTISDSQVKFVCEKI